MSRPATISGFSDDAPASSGYSIAGRRFANSPSSRRSPRIACSGRSGRGSAVVLPVADRAEQHRVGTRREVERRRRQRMAMRRHTRCRRRRRSASRCRGRTRRRPRRGPSAPRRRSRDRCRRPAGWRCSRGCRSKGNAPDAAGRDDASASSPSPRAAWRRQTIVFASQGRFDRCAASNARISSACRSVSPMSSKPFSRQYLRNGSTSNGLARSDGSTTS